MNEILNNNKVLLQKKNKLGNVYLIEMSVNLYVVVIINDNNIILSRSFLFSNKNKKSILKKAREYYFKIKKIILTKKINELEDLD